jgi:dinuclear metal center YbgI/SA1388 family protein
MTAVSKVGGVPTAPPLREVVGVLDDLYAPALAEPWDAVGLVCGDPAAPVRRIVFAVDPVLTVAAEALGWGADLLVTHHPLFLTAVHGVPATTAKGALVHALIRGGTALHVAHTNADRADPGVSDALARALGVCDLHPLAPAAPGSPLGVGRVGRLAEALPLARFVERAAAALPATAGGLRVAGDPTRTVRTVAVCGGSGDALLGAARAAGADVYLTADLRHHRAAEALEDARPGPGGDGAADGGPALIDAAHWASEWPWLPVAARQVRDALAARGTTVDTHVSRFVTDPWTAHQPMSQEARAER